MIREGIDGLVCDLDGVVYRGAEAIPGSVEALNRLRNDGVRIVYATNNSESTVQQYLDKLRGLGLEVEEEQIVTSAVVLAEVLRERNVAGRTALVVGGAGAVEAIEGLGVSILRDPSADEADMVIVGLDVKFDYEALRRASTAVREGATLIATNSDASYPVAGGLWPGSGSILAAIEVASGGTAEVMGKPHRPMMESALRRLPDASHIAMVGDRPDTDLAGATAMGWTTILVLSGVTTPEEVSALNSVTRSRPGVSGRARRVISRPSRVAIGARDDGAGLRGER